MAGRSKNVSQQFLSPAYFQAANPKIPSKKPESAATRLLPPSEYNVAKDQGEESAKAQAEINKLQNENKQLGKELERCKEEELRLEGEIRKSRIMAQKGRVDDALDLKRMAELQEENLSLQSEVRKLGSLTAKLKTDLKEVKSNFEADLERSEAELEKSNSLIKELKAELRQKEEIHEREVESLERRSRKQMAAVKNLKAEVKNAEEQVKIDRKGFEDVLSKNEYDKYEQIKALQKSLNACELKYSKELQEMREELSRRDQIHAETQNKLTATEKELGNLKDEQKEKEKEYLTQINEYHERLQACQSDFDKTLTELSSKIEKQTTSYQREVENLTGTLQRKDEELKAQSSVVNQLRAYIGENLPNTQMEKLQKENEEAKQNMTSLLQENDNLRSTVELLNVRLSSINEILSMQEAELIKFQTKFTKGNSDQGESVLTKWREKVFALLLQLKSQEIIREKEERNERAQVKQLKKELEESQKEATMLKHILADKKAEQQIEVNRNLELERKLEKCQQNEKRLKNFVADFQMSACSMWEVAQGTESFMEHVSSQMEEAFRRLAVFSQRVSFASGRVKFLQGLISHREMQLRNELSEAVTKSTENVQLTADGDDAVETEGGLSRDQLALEVKQLIRERDHLLAQARKDSETLERKEVVIKAQYEEQLEESASKISQLESLLKDERERGAVLGEKLENAEAELSERLETVEALKIEMAKHKDVAEKTLDKVLQAEQARYTEEFAKLEKQFNDIRREHTKAVVALRQAERQVEREKEKSAEQLSLQQKEYEMKLEKSRSQLRHIEKERNMLMATVQQEGFKVPRIKPKEFSGTSKEEEKENRDQVPLEEKRPLKTSRSKGKHKAEKPNVLADPRISSTFVQNERQEIQITEGKANEDMNLMQMTSVLKDLQSLSAALLTMDKHSEESQHSV